MKYCKNCGRKLADNMKFCGGCGAPQEEELQKKKQSKGKGVLLVLVVAVIVVAGAAFLFGNKFGKMGDKTEEVVKQEKESEEADVLAKTDGENGTQEKVIREIQTDAKNTLIINGHMGYSGAITEDGSLYMWGNNSDGQIGNGTTEDQLTPLKILSEVLLHKSDFGTNAAITKDGSLYMWGSLIGNGTHSQLTPLKINDILNR